MTYDEYIAAKSAALIGAQEEGEGSPVTATRQREVLVTASR
jgi:hypothetical protein